jgi:hypothetical protein
VHQLQALVWFQEPQVHGFAFHHLAKLGVDDREKLVHFQGRSKYFFKVIELCQTADGTERVISLQFVTPGRQQGRSSDIRNRAQGTELFLGNCLLETEDFNGATQFFVFDQRQIGDGEKRTPDVEMCVFFTYQILAG